MHIEGNIVNVISKEIFPGRIEIENEKIKSIHRLSHLAVERFILPGLIDSHIHIESSMVAPSEFARIAVTHGTVGTVSDPHEIANVMGIEGIDFMIENGKQVPFHFCFGVPSCVPATSFETAGSSIDAKQAEALLKRTDLHYLSEMMNYPGVLNRNQEVIKKIAAAQAAGKPIDGHAPGLAMADAVNYINGGFPNASGVVISTDHECYSYEEAKWKLQHGMKVLIREGSAAKNFEALIPLLDEFPDMIMFCSDDKHPDSLVANHINALCKRSVEKKIDLYKIIQAACINTVILISL